MNRQNRTTQTVNFVDREDEIPGTKICFRLRIPTALGS